MKPALLLHIFLCLFVYTTSFSQTPPTNNNPNDATLVTLSADSCTDITGSATAATDSGIGTPSCAAASADRWYKVIVPASKSIAVSGNGTAVFYTGAVGSLTEIACSTSVSPSSGQAIKGLTAGDTVYIRMMENGPQNYSYCIWEHVAPTNNNPNDATALAVGSGSCSGAVTVSALEITNSGSGGTPSCGGGVGSDVWYTAVVPASGNLTVRPSGPFAGDLVVYSRSGDSFTEKSCVSENSIVLSGQTSGETLYFRFLANHIRGPLEICAYEPIVPSNDTPASATALTVGSGACSSKTVSNTALATNSGITTPNCSFSSVAFDVWYTVVVPASGYLAIETFNIDPFFPLITVYTKDTANNFTELTGCASKVILRNVPANETLYIRVWNSFDRGAFEICAWEPTSFPANDLPAAATALTVGSGACSNKTAGDTTNASSSGVATPSCSGGVGSDVWYTAVVPASGNLAIETFDVGDTFFDSVLTAYTKDSSDNYMEIGCDDDGGADGLSKIILTGQTVAATLYIRVWGAFGERAPFEICAWDHAPLSISETELAALKVYPNPTTNILHIDTQLPVESVGEASVGEAPEPPEPQATVYSLTGAQVLAPVSLAETNPSLDVSVLPTGIYMLHITHDKGSVYIKFVKE